MRIRQIGNQKIIEFDDREDAIAYAEAQAAERELWMMIVEADLTGLLSPN